jgi:hypothetical protein
MGDRRQSHVRQRGHRPQTHTVSPRLSIVLLAATGVRRIWSAREELPRAFRPRECQDNAFCPRGIHTEYAG